MRILRRFNGPPGSGQGGYSCGLVAEEAGLTAASVSLRLPPPLDAELRLGGGRVTDGEGRLVAEIAELERVDVAVPEPPTEAQARAASARSPWRGEDHPFPTCFVCGPARDDGFALFTGPVDGDRDRCATTWTPAADQTGGPFVWAAMDCPSSVPVVDDDDPDGPFVLARLDVERLGAVAPGEAHVVHSWPIERDGRKRWAGIALHAPGGRSVARGRALWIGLRGRAPGAG